GARLVRARHGDADGGASCRQSREKQNEASIVHGLRPSSKYSPRRICASPSKRHPEAETEDPWRLVLGSVTVIRVDRGRVKGRPLVLPQPASARRRVGGALAGRRGRSRNVGGGPVRGDREHVGVRVPRVTLGLRLEIEQVEDVERESEGLVL